MVDTYTIYIANQSASTQTFWCFLQRPQELINDPGVFANSSAYLAVRPNDPGTNRFVIPVQYVVGAGANNQAVGLNVQVISNVTQDAEIGQKWLADYATVPPPMGPTLEASGTSPANTIAISSNDFDKVKNENSKWFSNMSFGILTQAGFIGMTWSPDPQITRTLTPTLTFYIAVGSYGSNTLASWNDVSNSAAIIKVPDNFQYSDCTVTYTQTGDWVVTRGKPGFQLAGDNLGAFLSDAYAETAALTYLSKGIVEGKNQTEALVNVHWHSPALAAEEGTTYLTGTLTVDTVLVAGFAFFILAGVRFSITRNPQGGVVVDFSYSGDRAAQQIKSLFTVGARLLFGGAPG